MIYQGLQFSNESKKTVTIDVEGYIGYDYYGSQADTIQSKEKMKAELKKIAALKAETIVVNINSYGGDVNHGISIHDLLVEHSAKIITKVNGMTASIATVIAMAGDERKMSDNALFLVHNASTFGGGDKNDLKMIAADLDKIDGKIANIYAKRTGKDQQEMLDLMNEEKGMGKWLTADEAKAFGFVTEIYEPIKAAAYYSNDILKRFNLPELPENAIQPNTDNIAEKIQKASISFFDRLAEMFPAATSKHENSNSNTMSKPEFKRLATAIGIDTVEAKDGKVNLTVEQIQKVEDLMEQHATAAANYAGLEEGETVTGLKTQITDLKKSETDLQAENATQKAEIEKLSKETVDETGAEGKDGEGKDKGPVDTQADHFYNLSKIQ